MFTGPSASAIVGDTATGAQWRCGSGSAGGAFAPGAGQTGTGIATFSSWTARTCTGPLGIPVTLTALRLPWRLDTGGYDPVTGTATGTLTGASMHWVGAAGGTADFDGPGGAGSGTGVLTVSYVNGSGVFTVTGGNLHVHNAAGEFLGLVNDGDPWTFGGSFTLNPRTTVTSP
ncbi:hypothetical protein [Actinacidiphila rubida]|uniref:hypothetical protein n=1 Tax=Actinacidiphila rubida TaxID=310780 RepID=UPI00099F42E5|nr:hypothetical protein [Actinacidiphila rubida]